MLSGYARNSKASLVQLNLAFISVLVSAYLGYVLIFLLDELCPVCISTYVINVILLLLSIFKGKPRIAERPGAPAKAKGDKTTSAPKDTAGSKDAVKPAKSYAQAAKEKKRA